MKYELQFETPQKKRFLHKDWRTANFDGKGDRKRGVEYEMTQRFELNEDGKYREYDDIPRYDLKLEHRVSNSVIWIRTIPLAPSDKSRSLDALMRSYVNAVSGADLYSVDMGHRSVVAELRRFATRVVEQHECVVGGRSAYTAAVEVASVDQLQLGEDSRWELARLVFISPPSEYSLPDRSTKRPKVPAVILVGFASDPETYQQGLADFEKILSRLAINGVRSAEAGRCTGAVADENAKNLSEDGAAQSTSAPPNTGPDAAQTPPSPTDAVAPTVPPEERPDGSGAEWLGHDFTCVASAP